jgi:tetratricopeptide (TPR) repeat protein
MAWKACARRSTQRAPGVSRIIDGIGHAPPGVLAFAAARSTERAIAVHALLIIVVSLLFVATPLEAAPAQSREEAAQALAQPDPGARRDAAIRLGEVGTMADVRLLVRTLRDADDDTRESAEQAIWHIWARSGDESVDRLYAVGVHQMEEGELRQGIATFTRIIEQKPEFAEAWNKRATLYFMLGELRKSLADCDEVVKRNPYHFGALAGYTQIYIRLEYYDRALDYARRALEVNPNMEGVRRNLMLLERLQEQRRQQMI